MAWADTYKKETNNGLNYQSIGSGGGIKQIKAKTVTFGASDAPLPGKELDESGLDSVPDGDGRHRVGRQHRGSVRRSCSRADAGQDLPRRDQRDDPAIAKLNPSAKLPSQSIAVVHLLGRLGMTDNFAYYLAEASPDWKSKVGLNTSA